MYRMSNSVIKRYCIFSSVIQNDCYDCGKECGKFYRCFKCNQNYNITKDTKKIITKNEEPQEPNGKCFRCDKQLLPECDDKKYCEDDPECQNCNY